jgi:hypothetical protein
MIATIDLDQFAQARTTGSWLIDLWRTLTARHPQLGIHHQLPDRFLRHADAVAFTQLLACQRRAEISIALAHNSQSALGQFVVQSPVPRHAALARDQSSRASFAKPRRQPTYLPRR